HRGTVAVALGQPVHGEPGAAGRRRVGQPQTQAAAGGGRLDALAADALDAGLERLGERRLARLGAPPVDQRLEAGDLGLLAGGDLGEADLVALAGRLVLRVRALVVGDLADV